MPNTQYMSYPATNWSGEISGGASQPAAHASATTSTTTTTTSTASAGPHMDSAAPHTTTTTTNTTAPSGAAGAQQSALPSTSRNEFEGSTGTLDLETHQPIEVIESPASMNEAFLGSMKSMLLRNRGSFVTATFLIGTQGTTTWEGILHDVGNDHVVIFQPGRQRYIACDLYALKYIEFYDTRERDACRQLLQQSTMNSGMNSGRNNFY